MEQTETQNSTYRQNYLASTKKLLDFGRRNPLLYFSYNRRHLPLLYPSSKEIFQSIVDGTELTFFDISRYLLKEMPVQDSALEEETLEKLKQNPQDYLPENNILSLLPSQPGPITSLLRFLSRSAKENIEDKGVNILYLAFGFLHWKDISNHDEEMVSPLILLPVTLHAGPGAVFSISKGALGEEDPVANATLAYKLEQDYKIELPEYSEDDTYTSYLSKVSSALSSRPDFTIEEGATIGIFSFSDLVIYKDLLRNEETALKSPLLASLLTSGGTEAIPPIPKIKISEWEGKLHNIVDADSSQMKAIIASKISDTSFVLVGPPGTGKSQTITNIIAESLYDGKKVLFVSEKMAALDVVYNKLQKANLGDFCFELHSNKTKKQEVTKELDRVLSMDVSYLSEEATKQTQRYAEAKQVLNDYTNALHETIPGINMSAFALMAQADAYRSYPLLEDCYLDNIQTLDTTYLENAKANLQIYLQEVQKRGLDYPDNVMYDYCGTYDYQGEVAFRKENEIAHTNLPLFRNQLDVLDKNGFNLFTTPLGYLPDYLEALQQVQKLSRFSTLITSPSTRRKASKALEKYLPVWKEYTEEKEILEHWLKDDCLDREELHEFFSLLETKYTSFWSRLSFGYHHQKKRIKPLVRSGKVPRYSKLLELSTHLHTYWELEKKVSAFKEEIESAAPEYTAEAPQYEPLQQDIELLQACPERAGSLLKTISESSFESLKNVSPEDLKTDTAYLYLRFEKNFFNPGTLADGSFIDLEAKIGQLQQEIVNLDSWARLSHSLTQAEKNHYTHFIQSYLSRVKKAEVKLEDIVGAFCRLFFNQWSLYAYNCQPILKKYNATRHNHLVHEFQELDKEKMKIAESEIRSALFKRFPQAYGDSTGAVNRLKQECQKRRNILSVRSLFSQYGDIIQKVKPCFLMSPLSVSTYLGPDMHFDVVVFDEASQVFPWEALGALYRADKAIISGDSKQMPPTSFFRTQLDDEEVDEEDRNASQITDFESILTYFAAFPQYDLRWHYRSRCEELINFSNHYFYDDNLITFPAIQKQRPGFGVDFIYTPNGVYDKRYRTNEAEAERVANILYNDCYLKRRHKSVGIIAFNISQQELIQDKIDHYCDLDPEFARYVNGSDTAEPLFVKNLETCQGDERDIILFSICYAYNREGKFYLSFGPLSLSGGERRLNVAVTRARENLIVVSSIHFTDIDMTRAHSLGAQRLRDYLCYAETKKLDIASPKDKQIQFDSPFEEEVYKVIQEAGYPVDTQVGSSSYRIDMAIRNKNNSGYVLAIECDGSSYHSSLSARDRDRLRQQVLEEKGWKFYRVWSTDWWKNFEQEKDRLLFAVKDAYEKETPPYNPGNGSSSNPVDDNSKQSVETPLPNLMALAFPDSVDKASQESPEATPESPYEVRVQAKPSKDLKDLFPSYHTVYEDASVKNVSYLPTFLQQTIEAEQPITLSLLYKRTEEFRNYQRITPNIRKQCDNALRSLLVNPTGIVFNGDSYYSAKKPISVIKLRLGDQRKITEIPEIEIIAAYEEILKNEYSLTQEDLYREFLSLFHQVRLTDQTKEVLDVPFEDAVNKGLIVSDDSGYYTIKTETGSEN